MSQFKRFNSSDNTNYNSGATYPEGTLTWDPSNGLRIHDGYQGGGRLIGVTNYPDLSNLPTNPAAFMNNGDGNHRQFLRYNKNSYLIEYADDFRVVDFADISYPNGVVGDKVGDTAFTDDAIYYCHTEPNFIGDVSITSSAGYSNQAWITLTTIPAAGPVQLGQKLTDGTNSATVVEIVEGWPGYNGSRMIIRLDAATSTWHDGTPSTLSVISSGTGVTTGNWVKFPSSVDANDLIGTTLASGVVNSSLTSVGTLTDLTVTGTTTLNGTSSNVVRRAFGLVETDTYVTLDDIKAKVTSSGQLSLILVSGSWQGTGWTETFQGGGTPAVSNWVNLPLSSGFDTASGAMPNQGNGCRCVISDQTPSAKVYQINVVRSGTTGAMWNISIERLV